MRRPCLDCGTPTRGNRCPSHQAQRDATISQHRGSATRRGYTYAWQKASKEAIGQHVQLHGWTCPGWRRPPHSVEPGTLTGDHPIAMAAGGPALPTKIDVLCRPCNSAKRER